MKSKSINYCQISKKKDLKSILNLGFLPPVNEYKKINSKNGEETFFPCELYYSPSSKLFQINTIVNKEILFPKSYPYTSSTTKILRDNFKELSEECIRLFNINKSDLALDIGSNDGNLLSNFKSHCRVLGITPESIGNIAIKRGIPTIIDYFNDESAKKIIKKNGKAKFIFATNVFAHIDDIKRVLQNIKKILTNDGIFISESHYFLDLVKTCQFDKITHEHLRYYTLTSLKKFFESEGLRVIFAKKINTHGGSIRVYASKFNYKFNKNNIQSIISEEKKFLTSDKLKKFKDMAINSKIENLKLLGSILKKKKKIFGISAPSRSTTLINYFGLNEDFIECILEIKGSYRIGKYVPGTKIPIYEETKAQLNKADYLYLFSWHIAPELISNIKKNGYKGKFIIPLPFPKII